MARLLACAAIAALMLAGAAHAEGDAAKGERVFNKCKSCHTLEQGGKNKQGPNLFGFLGRAAGAVEGFKYSKAMLESGIEWDTEVLGRRRTPPRSWAPATGSGPPSR